MSKIKLHSNAKMELRWPNHCGLNIYLEGSEAMVNSAILGINAHIYPYVDNTIGNY